VRCCPLHNQTKECLPNLAATKTLSRLFRFVKFLRQGLPQLHAFLAALPQSRPREGTSRVGSLVVETPAEDAAEALIAGEAPTTPPSAQPRSRPAAAEDAASDWERSSEASSRPAVLQVEQVLEVRHHP
jgi:hypothetical protein